MDLLCDWKSYTCSTILYQPSSKYTMKTLDFEIQSNYCCIVSKNTCSSKTSHLARIKNSQNKITKFIKLFECFKMNSQQWVLNKKAPIQFILPLKKSHLQQHGTHTTEFHIREFQAGIQLLGWAEWH